MRDRNPRTSLLIRYISQTCAIMQRWAVSGVPRLSCTDEYCAAAGTFQPTSGADSANPLPLLHVLLGLHPNCKLRPTSHCARQSELSAAGVQLFSQCVCNDWLTSASQMALGCIFLTHSFPIARRPPRKIIVVAKLAPIKLLPSVRRAMWTGRRSFATYFLTGAG